MGRHARPDRVIFRFIIDVASDRKKTWAEDWGLGNALALLNPRPIT
jgi:galactarate dehydratase